MSAVNKDRLKELAAELTSAGYDELYEHPEWQTRIVYAIAQIIKNPGCEVTITADGPAQECAIADLIVKMHRHMIDWPRTRAHPRKGHLCVEFKNGSLLMIKGSYEWPKY